jgi:hypothetical protein
MKVKCIDASPHGGQGGIDFLVCEEIYEVREIAMDDRSEVFYLLTGDPCNKRWDDRRFIEVKAGACPQCGEEHQ